MGECAWFICIPLPGHILPLTSIAHRLSVQDARFEEIVLVSDERVRPVVELHLKELMDEQKQQHCEVKFLSLGDLNEGDDIHWKTVVEPKVSAMTDFNESTKLTWEWFIAMWKPMYQSLQKHLLQQPSKTKPTVIIADFFTYAAVDIALDLQIPLVMNNPCLLPVLGPQVLPLFDFVPAMMTKVRKGQVTWFHAYLLYPFLRSLAKIFIRILFQSKFNKIRKSIGKQEIDLLEFPLPNVPYLVNSYWGIEYPRPINPLIHMTGPLVIGTVNSSSEEVDAFFARSDSAGVVLVSMGTLAQMNAEHLETFKQALLQFSQETGVNVIWKTSQVSPDQSSETLMVTKWLPSQAAILNHERTRAFVSHCGINSAQESLYFGKPILCIPMFGDQLDMAQRVEDAGAGVIISKTQICDKALVIQSLKRVVQEPSFTTKARQISKYFSGAGGTHEAARLVGMYASLGTLGVPEFVVGEVKATTVSKSSFWSVGVVLIISVVLAVLVR